MRNLNLNGQKFWLIEKELSTNNFKNYINGGF